MKNRKIRLVLILGIVLMSGFITTCFISYNAAHDSLTNQIAETTLPLTSDNIYSEIQRDLLQPIFISSLMAHDTFVRDWVMEGEKDEQAITRYLDEIQKKYRTVSCFFVSDKSRKYYHPLGVLKTVSEDDSDDEWYFRVKTMKDDYEINVDTDTADKSSLTIFINYRVYDYEGRYIGATGVGLAVKSVTNLINSYQSRYNRRVLFMNREGQIVLHSNNYSGPKDIRQVSGLSKYALELLTSPSDSVEYKKDGKTVFLEVLAK